MNTLEQIREKNDLFRQTMLAALGRVTLTQGVSQHSKREEVITLIRNFNDFNKGNDPHGEHDFGAVEIESREGDYCKVRAKFFEKFFFKIDYYDQKLECGADPYSEPVKRVLTIMSAGEY